MHNMESEKHVLSVKYSPSTALELTFLADSLKGIINEFRIFERSIHSEKDYIRSDLYIKGVRNGSVVIDIFNSLNASGLFDDCDKFNHIIDFSRNLLGMHNFFINKTDKPDGLSVENARNFARIIEPAAKDIGGSINICGNSGGVNIVNIGLTHSEAAFAHGNALNWAALQQVPVSHKAQEELFYWYQARDASSTKHGDKGIIEAISSDPIATICANDNVKGKMLNEALFKKAYFVEVEVHTVENKPKLYKILKVIQSIDK